MLHFKENVDVSFIKPQVLLAILVADQTNETGETWITSICDDAPGRLKKSLHGMGFAVDLRVSNHPNPAAWAKAIQTILPKYYDVVFGNDTHKDHIHIEYDNKNIMGTPGNNYTPDGGYKS